MTGFEGSKLTESKVDRDDRIKDGNALRAKIKDGMHIDCVVPLGLDYSSY